MSNLKQICVCRNDRIGDLIMTTPVLKTIRKNWPKSKITLLCSKNNSKVLKNSDLIDDIIILDNKHNIINKFKTLKLIRKKSFDLYVNFSPTNLSYIFCFFSRASKKATIIFLSRYKKRFSKIFQRFFSKIYCQHVFVVNRRYRFLNKMDMHQTIMMLELIKKIFNKSLSYHELEIPVVSKLEKKLTKVFSKKIITIHLSKRWINDYYSINDLQKLIFNLKKNKKYILLLTTEKLKDDKFRDITKNFIYLSIKDFLNRKLINKKLKKSNIFVLDNYKYNDWISIIKQSFQVITPESGCIHVAAAFKVPVFVIYNINNYPEYIYNEYSPWKSKHTKLLFKVNNNINKLILKKLN